MELNLCLKKVILSLRKNETIYIIYKERRQIILLLFIIIILVVLFTKKGAATYHPEYPKFFALFLKKI